MIPSHRYRHSIKNKRLISEINELTMRIKYCGYDLVFMCSEIPLVIELMLIKFIWNKNLNRPFQGRAQLILQIKNSIGMF